MLRTYSAVDIKMPNEEMQELAYRIIVNLRGALDHATTSASSAIVGRQASKANFPFRDSETDLLNQLRSEKGPYKDIPEELHHCLSSLRPFKNDRGSCGGNLWLFHLNKVANISKHQFLLETEVADLAPGIGIAGNVEIISDVHRLSENEFHIMRVVPISDEEPPMLQFELTPSLRISADSVIGSVGAA